MSSRDKGKRGEREIVKYYIDRGFDAIRTAPLQAGFVEGAADVSGVGNFHIEVKRQEALNIWKALEQSERDAKDGMIPTVHFRRNRSEWYVALKLDDFVRLMPPDGVLDCGIPAVPERSSNE
jgi:Holliday junction resolvase